MQAPSTRFGTQVEFGILKSGNEAIENFCLMYILTHLARREYMYSHDSGDVQSVKDSPFITNSYKK